MKSESNVFKKQILKSLHSVLRKQIKKDIKLCFSNYVKDCEEKFKVNTKCFIAFTKSLRKSNSLPQSMKFGSESASDRQSVCNLFAKSFKSAYQFNEDVEPPNHVLPNELETESNDVTSQFLHVSFTPDQVHESISSFSIYKVASPDNIPMLFFKNLSQSLRTPLCMLFNKSIKEKKFPSKWKISYVSPIFKSGDKEVVTNYRAVCILCAISKIFEKLLFKVIFEHVKSKIHSSQHGFFVKRSTLSNLMEYISTVSELIVNGGQIDSIYTDFSKAFDRVVHWILISKLRNFGINRNTQQWFKSYLSNRMQMVVIGGVTSEKIVPTSGVPQGSILGPLLFIMFINDLLMSLSSSLGFADDLKAFREIKTESDCYLLQRV